MKLVTRLVLHKHNHAILQEAHPAVILVHSLHSYSSSVRLYNCRNSVQIFSIIHMLTKHAGSWGVLTQPLAPKLALLGLHTVTST